MKTKFVLIARTALWLLLSTLIPQPRTLFAQGRTTPPGAPGPTMKTLDQIEPRVPISGVTNITQSGSYYLTTNITVNSGNAITIAAGGVMLDLNGFTIRSTAEQPEGCGILLDAGANDISIANGFIQGGVTNNGSGTFSGPGFGCGITWSNIPPANVWVTRVSVSGCMYRGIYLAVGGSDIVEACLVRTVGGYGIFSSTIKTCSAIGCGMTAIDGDQVADCRGDCSGSAAGVSGITIHNSYGASDSGHGIDAFMVQNSEGTSTSGRGVNAYTAQNCYGYSGNSYGLYAARTAEGCSGFSSSGTGLYAAVAQSCYGTSQGDGDGIAGATANNCYGWSAGSGIGVHVGACAANCYGDSASGEGVNCITALNCSGFSTSTNGIFSYIVIGGEGFSTDGKGIYCLTAIGSLGQSINGTGLDGAIGNSATGTSAHGTPENVRDKYNMPY